MAEKLPPVFTNKRVVLFGEIIVDEHSKCVFEPFMNRGHNTFGWDARPADLDGHNYIYVAPDTWSQDDDNPRFYLYVGPYGDPAKDRRLGPYNLKGDEVK